MTIDALTGRSSTYVNPLKESQQDFIHGVFLERGNMLDAEVRRIASEIETSNELIHSVNNLIAKSNIHQHSSMSYSQPTWKVSSDEKSIALDHGYGISLQKDGNGNNTLVIEDGVGNQLVYNNQTLVPVPAGKTVDALEVGIPVMSNMTFVLSDGTEITFLPADPKSAYNASNMSGGLADIENIVISRGNQAMKIEALNDETPTITRPLVEPVAGGNPPSHSFDELVNDGHVLMENGGLHQWEYDGVLTQNIQTNNLNDPDQPVSGYFARKQAFHSELNNEHTSTGTVLTQEERNMLTEVLKVTYSDASGTGNLTSDEWESLKGSLEAARDNLTGSNQLQTTQLQRALTSHNQNYDAMSNSLSRIYTLLKDIVARM